MNTEYYSIHLEANNFLKGYVGMDNKLHLVHRGAKEVQNYREVVAAGEVVTVVSGLSRRPNANLEASFFIFKNGNRIYLIAGIQHVDGVAYKTKPQALMDRTRFLQWLNEPVAIQASPESIQGVLYADNSREHSSTPEMAVKHNELRTTLQNYRQMQLIYASLSINSSLS